MKNKFKKGLKNFAKTMLVFAFIVPCMILLSACGKSEFKVDASVAKVGGITVKLDKELTKKQFSTDNGDSAGRVSKYGDLGELDQVTVRVGGTVSVADCLENATGMNETDGVVTGDQVATYYTDFFELKMLIPDGATQFKVDDGLPAKPVSELENTEGDYVVEKVQWLLSDANQSSWNICGVADTNDGYFYYAFLDDNAEVVKQFFVRVVYDVEFVD